MIKYTEEINLNEFEAWSGARETLNYIIEYNKVEEVEDLINDMFTETPTKTDINDFLWFEDTFIFEHIGIDPYNELED